MAVITPTVSRLPNGYTKVVWLTLTQGDTGAPVNVAQYPDRSVQATGTFSGSAVIAMQGSNDAATFGALRDLQGNAVALSTTQPNVLAENTEQVRPSVTSGDGSTDIDVFMICH